MSGITERIEGATARLAEQQQRIAASTGVLAGAHRAFDGNSLHDAQDSFPALESAVHELIAEVASFPEHANATIGRETEAITSEAAHALNSIGQNWSELGRALGHLNQTLLSLPEQVNHHLSIYPELLENRGKQLERSNAELTIAIQAVASSFTEAIVAQIDQSSTDFAAAFSRLQQLSQEKLQSRIERLADDGQSRLERSFGDLSRLAERGTEELDRTAKLVFQALEEELRRAVENKLPDAQRELVEHAVRALAEEIAEGIAMSIAGGSISAALTPHLHYLIAAKHALEFILQAIRIFKEPFEVLS